VIVADEALLFNGLQKTSKFVIKRGTRNISSYSGALTTFQRHLYTVNEQKHDNMP